LLGNHYFDSFYLQAALEDLRASALEGDLDSTYDCFTEQTIDETAYDDVSEFDQTDFGASDGEEDVEEFFPQIEEDDFVVETNSARTISSSTSQSSFSSAQEVEDDVEVVDSELPIEEVLKAFF
jgi:hypothetical protein